MSERIMCGTCNVEHDVVRIHGVPVIGCPKHPKDSAFTMVAASDPTNDKSVLVMTREERGSLGESLYADEMRRRSEEYAMKSRAADEQRLEFIKELRSAHYHWGKTHMDQTLEEYERQVKERLGL